MGKPVLTFPRSTQYDVNGNLLWDDPEETVVSVPEAARRLGVSPSYVYRNYWRLFNRLVGGPCFGKWYQMYVPLETLERAIVRRQNGRAR